MYKVLILQPKEQNGCDWYRLRQFSNWSRKLGLLDVKYINPNLPEELLQQVLEKADAYIIRLSDNTGHTVLDLMGDIVKKKPVFLDIDDAFNYADPLSDMYKSYGTEEVVFDDGTKLWEDGVNIDIKGNLKRLQKFYSIMRQCTAVITTTFELSNYARKYNSNVVVIPNSIDFSLYPDITDNTKKDIRVMWAGGSSHYPDLLEVRDQLTRVINNSINAKLYILGVPFKGIIRNIHKNKVVPHSWVTVDGHSYRLACMDADIGICPLKPVAFNYFKSSVKMYEYAALRIPTIAPNMAPYENDIKHGETGYLYNDASEFEKYLTELIDNPILCKQMGNNAYEDIKRRRNIEVITRDWAEFIASTIDVYKKTETSDSQPSQAQKEHIRIEKHQDFTLEPIKGKDALFTQQEGCRQLRKFKYWIASGNLLGLYRDKKLIDHDTDIDVEILASFDNPPKVELKGFTPILSVFWKEYPMQTAYIHDKTGVIFDIYYYYQQDNIAINYNMEGYIEMPMKYLDELGKLKHDGVSYPIPRRIRSYLKWRFGDWETPTGKKVAWQTEATHLTRWQ